jgi:hypothetical protein
MKILRSVIRRGYTVGMAGWFTTTTPNRWFPASRYPESFRQFGSQSKESALSAGEALDRVLGKSAPTSPQFMTLSTNDQRPARFALVAVLAAAAASFILWWFFHIAV